MGARYSGDATARFMRYRCDIDATLDFRLHGPSFTHFSSERLTFLCEAKPPLKVRIDGCQESSNAVESNKNGWPILPPSLVRPIVQAAGNIMINAKWRKQ